MRSYSIDNSQGQLDSEAFFSRLEMIAPRYHRNKWVKENFSACYFKPLDKVVIRTDLDPDLVKMIAGPELEVISFSQDWENFTRELVESFRERKVVMSDYDAGV